MKATLPHSPDGTKGGKVPYMHGNEYWPEIGEDVLRLLGDICRVAKERGGIVLCFNTKRITVTPTMTPNQVRQALGL